MAKRGRPSARGGSKKERAAARRQAAARQRAIRNGVIVVAVAAVVGLFAVIGGGSGEALAGVAEQEAWDLPALDGEGRIALTDFAGKPTVAAFFASWCPHCRRELPGFAELSTELGDQVDFVGINTQDSGRGKSLAEAGGIDAWPLARDIGSGDQRDLSTAFGARGMPLTVIYDAGGTVAHVQRGVLSAADLRALLRQLFAVG